MSEMGDAMEIPLEQGEQMWDFLLIAAKQIGRIKATT